MTHHHDGIRVTISPRGMAMWRGERPRFVDEECLSSVDRLYADIRLGALAGALLTIACLVIKHLIWG